MRLLRRLSIPATESQTTIALAAALVVMALLLGGILWQASVIAEQRDVIRWLWSFRFGG